MKKITYLLTVGIFMMSMVTTYAQVTVNGTITGTEGETLIGATITEKGTLNGTATDIDGRYSMQVADNATLVVSYTGLKSKEVQISSGGQMNIALDSEAQILDEVFITATSKPIRRIQATTAIEAISAKEIERMNPTGLADLVRYTPGVFVQNKAGRTRNFIFMRGFPDGTSNGLLYTSIMIDGLKTFGSTEMVPDASFRNDLNLERVEIVRGSAATLYGRGAAAGAVNLISKTGGTETKGAVKLTAGNNNWYQLDANLNGPLSRDKSWRYNVGGFWLTDDGYRNGPFGDKGGQVRFNIDKILANNKGKFRISGGLIDLDVNNYLDIPYAINDLSKPAGDWKATDVVLQDGNAWEGQAWPVEYPSETASNEYDEWYPRGNFSQGWNVGMDFSFDIGNNWTLSNKARYQDMIVGVSFDFPINNVGGAGNSSVATYGDSQLRAVIGGGRSDGGSAATDLMNELRLVKRIQTANSSHALTIGGYVSLFETLASADGALYTVNSSSSNNIAGTENINPFFPGVFSLSFRNSNSHEDTYSFFAGDEMTFGEKFTLNVGGRYDIIKLDLADNRGTSEELQTSIDHAGISVSAGFNYLMTPLTAIYGNITRSYRAPDFGTYTPVREGPQPGTLDKPKITENENITSFEIGYRKSTGDFSFDGGLFWSDIANRRVAAYIGAIATQVPAGDNHIRGAEVSLIYTPQSVKGLYARTSLTAQATNLTNFESTISYIDPSNPDNNITETVDLEGNQLMDVPPMIWNLTIGYTGDKFGFNVNNNTIAARWADPYNTVKYPSRSLVNANLNYKLTNNLRLGLASTNLFNNDKIASAISVRNAGSPTLYVANKHGNTGVYENFLGIPLLPRRILATLQYDFGVKPKVDTDGDGIADSKDACTDDFGLKAFNGCPDTDMDGIIDSEDGCPNAAGDAANMGCPDSDGDGVLDKDDNCPNTAGNVSGCPDGDGDGVADRDDACPNDAGTLSGCPDGDGDGVADKDDACPSDAGNVNGCPDGDGDGVADKDDKCPNEKGDKSDGCPSVVDSDGDGVEDKDDRCPNTAGAINGCPDTDKDGVVDIDDKCPKRGGNVTADGCPKVVSSKATEVFSRAIKGITFNSGSDVITRESYGILDEVVAVMSEFPDLNLSVEGHTDSQGNDQKNMDLSSRRAAAVVTYLMNKGVAGTRMSSRGFGETTPVADNNTTAGRKTNRRVELRGRY